MVAPAKRLAQAVGGRLPSTTTQHTAEVVEVDTDDGTATLRITEGDGTTLDVPGVRFQAGSTPQVGRQVTYVMNGTEPYILSESGDIHDPVFQGRVVAASFHALPGPNLLAPGASDTAPWIGWGGEGLDDVLDTTTALVAAIDGDALILASPVVTVDRPGRHYTGWVDMPDDGLNAQAYVELRAFDASGALLTSWGSFVDAVRLPGQSLRRYPAPDANQYLSDAVVGLQLRVRVAAGPTGEVSLTEAYIGTSPVLEGGAVLLGRTQIDQAGMRLDGEDILSPWTETTYTNGGDGFEELGGANWTVRHRRIGKVGFVECTGTVAGATSWSIPTELPLPYASAAGATVGMLHGYLLNNGVRYYPVVASIEVGGAVVRRILHTGAGGGGSVTDSDPFALGAGDQIQLSGSYEID